MTSPIPLTPEQAEARRGTVGLSISRKRDALEGRLFKPTGYIPEVPEPTAREIASALARLKTWLEAEGITFAPNIITQIATSSAPWRIVEQQLQGTGSPVALETIQTAVNSLHEDTFRLSNATRSQAAILGPVADPEGRDDTSQYRQEHQRLTTDHGMSDSQAHQLLAEWGWENPLYRPNDFGTGVLQLAEGLAIARATGEYTGPLEPEDLLAQPTFESAMQLLEKDYTGAQSFEQFQFEVEIEGIAGISDDPIQASEQADAAEEGKPEPPDDDENLPARQPIGVALDYVARVAPRPFVTDPKNLGAGTPLDPNRPRVGSPNRFGIVPGIEQPPEYFIGDDTNIFNGLSPEVTILYQTMLVDAGWLSPEDFKIEKGAKRGGFETWNAMNKAMWAANATVAETWIEAAQDAAAARELAGVDDIDHEPVPVWTPATYLSPDPDTLSQVVKQAFRNQLGREPTAQEVRSLMSSLAGEFLGQFETQEAIDKAAFEQGIAATDASRGPIDPETGERTVVPLDRPDPTVGGGLGPHGLSRTTADTFRTVDNPLEQIVGVDPISSFQEDFEARFAEELARGRQRVTQRDARRSIMGSIFAIDAAVGGGR